MRVELQWLDADPPDASLIIDSLVLREAPRPSRPSIVFISIDTLSAKHMSLHRYARETTPNIDRFADEAVVFEHCLANAPWTTPSYMSQFTGLYASVFRDRNDSTTDESTPWFVAEEHWTLAELLRGAGYRAAAFTDNPNIRPELGLAQGFEVYDTSAADITVEDAEGGIRHIVPLALDWLDGLEGDAPFFLFVQALDVHGPYLPDQPWKGRYASDELSQVQVALPVALEHGIIFGAIPKHIADPVQADGPWASEMQAAPFIAAYDEEILALDAAVGAFLRELEARDLLLNTIVILSADHGESMVEHDSFFDHQLTYESDLHVPLIIRPPGGLSDALRVSETVQLVDLYPTVMELVGLPHDRKYLHGQSLVPLLEGKSLPSRPIVSHGDLFDMKAIVLDGWKLIEVTPSPDTGGTTGFLSYSRVREWISARYPELRGRVFGTEALPPSLLEENDLSGLWEEARSDLTVTSYELYHLAEDPDERRNVAEVYPEKVEMLRRLLDRESARAEEARLSPAADRAPGPTPVDRKELEKLGY